MLESNQRLNSKQQIVYWLADPVTEMFFQYINKEISDLQENLLSGRTLGNVSTAAIVAETAKIIGATGALKFTLEKIINDMKQRDDDE